MWGLENNRGLCCDQCVPQCPWPLPLHNESVQLEQWFLAERHETGSVRFCAVFKDLSGYLRIQVVSGMVILQSCIRCPEHRVG